MIYDDLDFFVLKKLYYSSPITTSELAKEFWSLNRGDKYKNREIDTKVNLIKYRLRKMDNSGLIIIDKNDSGENEYNLIEENVIFRKHKFPDGYFPAILLRDCGKWCIFQD